MNEKYEIRPTKKQMLGRLLLIFCVAVPIAVLFIILDVNVFFGGFKVKNVFLIIVMAAFTIAQIIFIIAALANTFAYLSGKGSRIIIDGERITAVKGKDTKEYTFSDIRKVEYDQSAKPEYKYLGLTMHFNNNDNVKAIRFHENFDKLLYALEKEGLVQRDEDFYKPVKLYKWL